MGGGLERIKKFWRGGGDHRNAPDTAATSSEGGRFGLKPLREIARGMRQLAGKLRAGDDTRSLEGPGKLGTVSSMRRGDEVVRPGNEPEPTSHFSRSPPSTVSVSSRESGSILDSLHTSTARSSVTYFEMERSSFEVPKTPEEAMNILRNVLTNQGEHDKMQYAAGEHHGVAEQLRDRIPPKLYVSIQPTPLFAAGEFDKEFNKLAQALSDSSLAEGPPRLKTNDVARQLNERGDDRNRSLGKGR